MLLSLLCFFLPGGLVFASSSPVITSMGPTVSGSALGGGTEWVIQGSNLPILSNATATSFAGYCSSGASSCINEYGYDFTDFGIYSGGVQYIAGSPSSGTNSSYGVLIDSSSSSQLVFTFGSKDGVESGSFGVALAPVGTAVSSASVTYSGSTTSAPVIQAFSADASVSNGVVSVQVNGGSAPYSVVLAGQTKSVSAAGGSVSFPGLPAGSYTATVDDASGASVTSNTVTVVGLSASVQAVSSSEAAVTVSGGTAPYSVVVNGRTESIASSGGSADFTGLASGSYEAYVTDAGGRKVQVSFVMAGALSGSYLVSGSSLTVTAKGGTSPYSVVTQGVTKSISASGGSVTFLGLKAGSYDAVLSDSAGHSVSMAYSISGPPLSISGAGGISSVTVDISGGVPPYAVQVQGGPSARTSGSTVTFKGLAQGTYDVIVTDAVGSEVAKLFTVGGAPTPLSVAVDPQPTSAWLTWTGAAAPFSVVYGGTTLASNLSSGSTGYMMMGLHPGARYKVSVSGGGFTQAVAFTTPLTAVPAAGLANITNAGLNVFERVGHWVVPVMIGAMLLGVLVVGSWWLWRLLKRWFWSSQSESSGIDERGIYDTAGGAEQDAADDAWWAAYDERVQEGIDEEFRKALRDRGDAE